MMTVDISGVENFVRYYEAWPKVASRAMSLAINDTMRDVLLPLARKHMMEEVNFPEGYLDRPDRLAIEQFARPELLEGIVAGRDRPTSLAQFAVGGEKPSGRKWTPIASIEVHPGQMKTSMVGMAYLIPLRRGETAGGNVGLAIRLRPGERLRNIREFTPIEIFPDVYILYGPSVDQVFRGVAIDIAPEVTSALEAEFNRQFQRLLADA